MRGPSGVNEVLRCIYIQPCMYTGLIVIISWKLSLAHAAQVRRGRMARKTKEEAEATRSRLLDAAEEVFHAQGVAGASLADVAQAAGMTRGAIYWHFKDKVDLFEAMMGRVTLPLERALSVFSSQSTSPERWRVLSGLTGVLHSLASDARARRVFEIALFKMEHVGDLIEVRQRRIENVQRLIAGLQIQLQHLAQQHGCTLMATEEVVAQGLYAVFDGTVQLWLLQGGGFDLEYQGRSLMQAYLCGAGFPEILVKKM